MRIKLFKQFLLMLVLFNGQAFFGQNKEQLDLGRISGNVQVISQLYNEDSLIGATLPDFKMGLNSFANINYNRGDFAAGIRYESYLNPLSGYPTTFNGTAVGVGQYRCHHTHIGIECTRDLMFHARRCGFPAEST